MVSRSTWVCVWVCFSLTKFSFMIDTFFSNIILTDSFYIRKYNCFFTFESIIAWVLFIQKKVENRRIQVNKNRSRSVWNSVFFLISGQSINFEFFLSLVNSNKQKSHIHTLNSVKWLFDRHKFFKNILLCLEGIFTKKCTPDRQII